MPLVAVDVSLSECLGPPTVLSFQTSTSALCSKQTFQCLGKPYRSQRLCEESTATTLLSFATTYTASHLGSSYLHIVSDCGSGGGSDPAVHNLMWNKCVFWQSGMVIASYSSQIDVRFFSDAFCTSARNGSYSVVNGECLNGLSYSVFGSFASALVPTTTTLPATTSNEATVPVTDASATPLPAGGSSSNAMSGGVIGGIVAGICVVFIVAGFFIYKYFCLSKNKKDEEYEYDPNYFRGYEATPVPITAAAAADPSNTAVSATDREVNIGGDIQSVAPAPSIQTLIIPTPSLLQPAQDPSSSSAQAQAPPQDSVAQFDAAIESILNQGNSTESFMGAVTRARATVRRMSIRRQTNNYNTLVPAVDTANVAFWSVEDTAEWVYVNGGGARGVANVHDQKIDGRVILGTPVAELTDSIGSDTLADRVRLQKAILTLKDSILPAYDDSFLTSATT
ncbi:hypothetical protein BDR26DRAFT_920646 [Obelidium mucronatum]|nr:hypothetical protein BDR26DRAFT_920646 [Obelidium mucronatum]